MNKFLGVILISCLFFSFDLPKSSVKKIDKVLAELWPEKKITQTILNASDSNVFKINVETKPTAYLIISKARSKISEFDYMVVFDSKLTILKVKVLIYREEYGGEIGSNRWLKQFIGKSDPEEMKFGYDIQNISGATISARSITEDVKNVTQQIKDLKSKGLLN